jgi:LemA protein
MHRTRYFLSRAKQATSGVILKRYQIFIVLLVALAVFATVYYYNKLVSSQQDMESAGGKVQALLQRRNDISINLSKATLDYSIHEQNVFTAIVTLRSVLKESGLQNEGLQELIKKFQNSVPGPGSAAGKSLLPQAGLIAIAEQYPDLKLSANFQNLMNALIEVERDLASERIKLNDKINIYTTIAYSFPGNIIAMIFGFELQPYFEATPEAKTLKPIEY